MAFRLHIGFVGECLFVSGPGMNTMPVLLPVVPAGEGTEAFAATLCFDPAHLQPRAPTLHRGTAMLPMQRVSLALSSPGDPLVPTLPPDIAPVGAFARRPIIPTLFENAPPDSLAARVDLGSGRMLSIGEGADWSYPECARFTNSLLWGMEMEGDRLDLDFASFPGPGGFRCTLYPIDESIRVDVYNTPVADLPPNLPTGNAPSFGTRLLTFGAYYRMFEPPVLAEPLPSYCGEAEAAGPYTCMLAQSPATPTE
jgi:hypothetical protein